MTYMLILNCALKLVEEIIHFIRLACEFVVVVVVVVVLAMIRFKLIYFE